MAGPSAHVRHRERHPRRTWIGRAWGDVAGGLRSTQGLPPCCRVQLLQRDLAVEHAPNRDARAIGSARTLGLEFGAPVCEPCHGRAGVGRHVLVFPDQSRQAA